MEPVPLTGLEIGMAGLFVAGLLWLIIDIAIYDVGMFDAMIRDSEAFARDPATGPDEIAAETVEPDEAAARTLWPAE